MLEEGDGDGEEFGIVEGEVAEAEEVFVRCWGEGVGEAGVDVGFGGCG